MKVLAKAKRPVIILGSTALQRPDGTALFSVVSQLAEKTRAQAGVSSDWKVLNILHRVIFLFLFNN